jgi:hypothetical protein
MFGFQRAKVMKLDYLTTDQDQSQAIKREDFSLTGSPLRAEGSKGEFVLSLRRTISLLRWEAMNQYGSWQGGCLS